MLKRMVAAWLCGRQTEGNAETFASGAWVSRWTCGRIRLRVFWQCRVVRFVSAMKGDVPWFWHWCQFSLPTVAAFFFFSRCLPHRVGCNSVGRVVIGDFFVLCFFLRCFFCFLCVFKKQNYNKKEKKKLKTWNKRKNAGNRTHLWHNR